MGENGDEYYPRLIDDTISDDLRLFGGVVITGPKYCGKTTTAGRKSKSQIYLQDKVQYGRYADIAKIDPSLLLKGDTPVLVDEWQTLPDIWGAVRNQIDRRKEKGLFLLTGSSRVNENSLEHSGAGRIKREKMRTMSLWEQGRSTGDVSLKDLFDGTDSIAAVPDYNYQGMARNLVRGGWPDCRLLNDSDTYNKIEGYCNAIIDHNFKIVSDGSAPQLSIRSNRIVRALLRSLARASASPTSAENLRKDMGENGMNVNINTVYTYLQALQNICITEDLSAWSPYLRSKTAIRTSDVRHLCDPALAAYFLDAGPDDLTHDPKTFGLLFESLAIRDLRVYAQTMNGHVCHYHDGTGLEVDAIVHLPEGRWGAIEVKLNDNWADKGAENLKKLRDRIDLDRMKAPSFLAVVTADGAAYTREDGVHVIPLSCLKNRCVHIRILYLRRTVPSPQVSAFISSRGSGCRSFLPSNTEGISARPSIPGPIRRTISSRSPTSKKAVLISGPPTIPRRLT